MYARCRDMVFFRSLSVNGLTRGFLIGASNSLWSDGSTSNFERAWVWWGASNAGRLCSPYFTVQWRQSTSWTVIKSFTACGVNSQELLFAFIAIVSSSRVVILHFTDVPVSFNWIFTYVRRTKKNTTICGKCKGCGAQSILISSHLLFLLP